MVKSNKGVLMKENRWQIAISQAKKQEHQQKKAEEEKQANEWLEKQWQLIGEFWVSGDLTKAIFVKKRLGEEKWWQMYTEKILNGDDIFRLINKVINSYQAEKLHIWLEEFFNDDKQKMTVFKAMVDYELNCLASKSKDESEKLDLVALLVDKKILTEKQYEQIMLDLLIDNLNNKSKIAEVLLRNYWRGEWETQIKSEGRQKELMEGLEYRLKQYPLVETLDFMDQWLTKETIETDSFKEAVFNVYLQAAEQGKIIHIAGNFNLSEQQQEVIMRTAMVKALEKADLIKFNSLKANSLVPVEIKNLPDIEVVAMKAYEALLKNELLPKNMLDDGKQISQITGVKFTLSQLAERLKVDERMLKKEMQHRYSWMLKYGEYEALNEMIDFWQEPIKFQGQEGQNLWQEAIRKVLYQGDEEIYNFLLINSEEKASEQTWQIIKEKLLDDMRGSEAIARAINKQWLVFSEEEINAYYEKLLVEPKLNIMAMIRIFEATGIRMDKNKIVLEKREWQSKADQIYRGIITSTNETNFENIGELSEILGEKWQVQKRELDELVLTFINKMVKESDLSDDLIKEKLTYLKEEFNYNLSEGLVLNLYDQFLNEFEKSLDIKVLVDILILCKWQKLEIDEELMHQHDEKIVKGRSGVTALLMAPIEVAEIKTFFPLTYELAIMEIQSLVAKGDLYVDTTFCNDYLLKFHQEKWAQDLFLLLLKNEPSIYEHLLENPLAEEVRNSLKTTVVKEQVTDLLHDKLELGELEAALVIKELFSLEIEKQKEEDDLSYQIWLKVEDFLREKKTKLAKKMANGFLANDDEKVMVLNKGIEIFGQALSLELYDELRKLYEGKEAGWLKGLGITKTGNEGWQALREEAEKFKECFWQDDSEVLIEKIKSNKIWKILFKSQVRYLESEFGKHGEEDFDQTLHFYEKYAQSEQWQPLKKEYEPSENYQIKKTKNNKMSEELVGRYQKWRSLAVEVGEIWREQGSKSLTYIIEYKAKPAVADLIDKLQDEKEIFIENNQEQKEGEKFKNGLKNYEKEIAAWENVPWREVSQWLGQLPKLMKKGVEYSEIKGIAWQMILLYALMKNRDSRDNQLKQIDNLTNFPRSDDLAMMSEIVNNSMKKEFLEPLLEKEKSPKLVRQAVRKLLSTSDMVQKAEQIRDENEVMTVQFWPNRNILSEFSGHIAGVCWANKYKSVLQEFPNLATVLMVDKTKTDQELMGAFLLLETKAKNGEELLVIRGLNPLLSWCDEMEIESFYEKVVNYVKKIAKQSGRKAAIVIDGHCGGSATNRPKVFQFLEEKKHGLARVKVKNGKENTFNDYRIGNSVYLV